jgi:hypothetical protein
MNKLFAWMRILAAIAGGSLRGQSVAPAPPSPPGSGAYPGLPALDLSYSAQADAADFSQLAGTTRWVVANGGWEQHRDALDKALVSAALRGSAMQYPANMERILALRTPWVMLSQDTVLHAIDPSVFGNLSKDQATQDFLLWLFTTPRAIAYLGETLKPQDRPQRVLEIWRDCWKADREGAEKYMALALAVAVDFDDPVSIDPEVFGQTAGSASSPDATYVDPVERYEFYRSSDTRNRLKVTLSDLQPYELAWVVDAPVPSSELVWAQEHADFGRSDWGQAYFSIRYRMDRATADRAAGAGDIYDQYTLAEIKKQGGICVDQAYYASITAKANGIPAMAIGGEGDSGGHAWVQWEASRNTWSVAGRYAEHFAAGTTTDPQTHLTVKEQELYDLTVPQRRSDGWAVTEGYLELAAVLTGAGHADVARQALNAAVQVTPQDDVAWNRLLDNLAATKAGKEDWESEIAQMRGEFQNYPDIIQQINQRETQYLMATADAGAAMAAVAQQTERFLRRDNSRTDLYLDGIFQEADLATQAGDLEKAGQIFHDALREKGGEAAAFRPLAQHYYDWGEKQSRQDKVLRDIDQAFERNFQPAYDDYFQLNEYRDLLGFVIDLYTTGGSEADLHRLERISKKVDEELKYLSAEAARHSP